MANEIMRLMNDEIESFTTIDTTTLDGRKALLKISQNEPEFKVNDFIGKQITFSDVYMEKVQIEDEVKVGKFVDAIRTVINTPNGTISATSEGFAKSVMMIINCLGKPSDWEEEYYFEVRQIETRKGRRYFKLQLAE